MTDQKPVINLDDAEAPKSNMQLRAELRKARIDIGILTKQRDAARAKVAQLEASAALLREMALDEEPSCP